MFLKRLMKRLRGALGVATLWGGVWFLGGLLFSGLLGLTTGLPWPALLGMAGTMGRIGFLTGGAFSAYLTFGYRNKSLAEISTARVARVGGLVAAVLSPGMAATAGLFGALAAATSIRAAKSALDPFDALDAADGQAALPSEAA